MPLSDARPIILHAGSASAGRDRRKPADVQLDPCVGRRMTYSATARLITIMVSAFYAGFEPPHIAHADLSISHRAGRRTVIHRPQSATGTPACTRMRPAMRCQLRLAAESRRDHTDAFEALLNWVDRAIDAWPVRDGNAPKGQSENGIDGAPESGELAPQRNC